MNATLRRLAVQGNKDAKRALSAIDAWTPFARGSSTGKGPEKGQPSAKGEASGRVASARGTPASASSSAKAGVRAGQLSQAARGEPAQPHRFGRGLRNGDERMEAGKGHEKAGSHQEAMSAYKTAALAYRQHINDCGYAEGYSLPQIRAIHARMNAEKEDK